jgi:cell division protein FtsQ
MANQNARGANRRQNTTESYARSGLNGLVEKSSVLLLMVTFSLIVYGGALAYRQIDRPLTNVMIGGDFNYLLQQELATLVYEQIDGGFLSVDLTKLHQVIQDQPWVDQVSIRRQWPSSLQVKVIEEVPIARWGKNGFLNRLGEELKITDSSKLQTLPVLRSDYGTSLEMMQQYQSMALLLAPTGLKLVELQRDNLGAWRVDTESGLHLVLGRKQLVEKLRRFALVWDSGLNRQLNNIKIIDLRYPNGLAVAWKDGMLVDAQLNAEKNPVRSVQG